MATVRVPRIYQDVELQTESFVSLDAQAAVHVARVLRLKKNDSVILFNGKGGEYRGVITELERRSVIIKLIEYQDSDRESPLKITLAQCISKGDRMDYAIQKSVELGVTEIALLDSALSAVHLSADRMEKRRLHWQKIAISACEQCGRNIIPVLHPVTRLSDWLSSQSLDYGFILVPTGGVDIKKMDIPFDAGVSLLIGPEGGLSEEEIQQAGNCGFTPVTLSSRILRTETAAVVALTVMQALWGDFFKKENEL